MPRGLVPEALLAYGRSVEAARLEAQRARADFEAMLERAAARHPLIHYRPDHSASGPEARKDDVVNVGGGLRMVKPTRAVIGRAPRRMGSGAGPCRSA
jgi:hypothetical protein